MEGGGDRESVDLKKAMKLKTEIYCLHKQKQRRRGRWEWTQWSMVESREWRDLMDWMQRITERTVKRRTCQSFLRD